MTGRRNDTLASEAGCAWMGVVSDSLCPQEPLQPSWYREAPSRVTITFYAIPTCDLAARLPQLAYLYFFPGES